MKYCRKIIKQFSKALRDNDTSETPRQYVALIMRAIHLAKVSQKFLLPEGGHLLDDKEYRALDDTSPLRLPYPIIALEYNMDQSIPNTPEEHRSSKRILFARETGNGIVVMSISYLDHGALWMPTPEVGIPQTNYLDRKLKGIGGCVAIKIAPIEITKDFPGIPNIINDYIYEVRVLLSFLNALQCSNVHTEKTRLPLSKKERSKSAISFDEYHILTVDVPGKVTEGSGKGIKGTQKREHLRRGHIRRCANGLKIWVNATVINAGKGLNKVKKDYLVCSSF